MIYWGLGRQDNSLYHHILIQIYYPSLKLNVDDINETSKNKVWILRKASPAPILEIEDRQTDRPTDGQHLLIKSPCRRLKIIRKKIMSCYLCYFIILCYCRSITTTSTLTKQPKKSLRNHHLPPTTLYDRA